MDYQEAWDLQCRFADEIAAGQRPATLLLLEHPHTFTFGRNGHVENLLWNPEELERRKVKVFWVDRGGDVTYHGPGQLVGYPLLPLAPAGCTRIREDRPHLVDYIGYLRKLERVLIAVLSESGLPGCRTIEGLTGVWAPGGKDNQLPAKIASIGVKVDARGITRHGFALNVQPEMSYWHGIIGCGLANVSMTSLAEWVPAVPALQVVEQVMAAAFGREFGFNMFEDSPPENRFFV